MSRHSFRRTAPANSVQLHTVIFFVTSRCNAKCRTCFYWQELNQHGDLSFDEIDTLSRTMPAFKELWLSGGEPMMRHRLDEIVKMFYDRNGIRTLNLPTNGLFKDRVANLLAFASQEMPELEINLNVALDGFAETHDRIRGVPGNFEKAIDSLKALYPLRATNPNIRLHVNSVITSENIDELERLGRWLVDNLDLNGQYFQVIRGNPMDTSLKTLTPERLTDFYASIKPIHEHYGRKLAAKHGGSVKGWLKKFYYTQTIFFHYTVQENNFVASNPWPMPCMAGQTIIVIDYNGDLRACELRSTIANLREVDCDFSRIYPSEAVQQETEQIVKDQCWCTHICFIHDSIRSSRRVLAYDIPLKTKVMNARRPAAVA